MAPSIELPTPIARKVLKNILEAYGEVSDKPKKYNWQHGEPKKQTQDINTIAYRTESGDIISISTPATDSTIYYPEAFQDVVKKTIQEAEEGIT